MTVTRHEVRPGTYYDSAVLMQLQKRLSQLPGIVDAGAVMATQANCSLLQENGLLPELASGVSPEDLLIVIQAEDDVSATKAIGSVDVLLSQRSTITSGKYFPRSVEAATKTLEGSNWALISVPGMYAAGVAEKSLDLGLNVFLYSDNVSVEEEVRLKRAARENGLLLMGPDCGTAIINGVGFGFANLIRSGRIGVISASGTGLQAVSVGIHNLGGGISQAVGTGGRDLKAEVGGITSLQALEHFAADADTDVVVLISKPPDADVAGELIGAARAIGKPAVVYFIGYPTPARRRGDLRFAVNLSEAAGLAVSLQSEGTTQEGSSSQDPAGGGGFLRGLFSGGTLASEALAGLQSELSPLYSNVPNRPGQNLDRMAGAAGHTLIDLGSDEYTSGRLHPMIDNDLRLRLLREESRDPGVRLILMDIVLGLGAHPDPASEIAPAIAEAKKRRDLDIVLVIVGTDGDPQNLPAQESGFQEAGAVTYQDLQAALEFVSARLSPRRTRITGSRLKSLSEPVAAVNVGLESFYTSVLDQGARALHVDWRPPAGGNEKLAALLNRVR